jgi:hypothetical protein
VPAPQRVLLAVAASAALALFPPARHAGAFTCSGTDGGGCPLPGATCFVACDEADLRDALETVNGCPPYAPGDEVTLAMGPDADTTCAAPIPLVMAPTAPAVAPGACSDFNADRYNALCLAGVGIVLDGRGAVFRYAGDHICASCAGECTLCTTTACAHRQPALLVLRGERNTVRDLEMRFFPEGIQIRDGDGHVVERVTARFVCEDAITVNAGTGHRVADNVLAGNTDPAVGGGLCFQRIEGSACTDDTQCPSTARCYCGEMSRLGDCAAPPPPPLWPAATQGQCYRPTRCGRDKAIQVNGGESTIEGNRIDTIEQPVHVDAGTHTVADNLTCGSHRDANVCQAYDVSGGLVTLRGNRIDHCKFGIRVVDGGRAQAIDNVLTNGWISAFQVKGTGGARLKGAGNRMRRHGSLTTSDCQRGALVVVGDPASRVDFGGGDGARLPVLGGLSPGGNVFCQAADGGPALAHLWNVTDCACALTPGCSCSMATNVPCGAMCPFAAPCCALEADGACAGSVGQDASVGIGVVNGAANAFDPLPRVFPQTAPNVIDRAPVRSRVANAVPHAACHAVVVPECECLGESDGAPCNDGSACTAVDVCLGGVCVGTQQTACPPRGACRDAGVCDPLTGACSDPPMADGAACEDGAACTVGDTCRDGACVAGGPGPDADGDGVCNAVDGCPQVADSAQRDLDADGEGDACDRVDAPLDLARAVLRRRGARGALAARGTFGVAPGDAFGAVAGLAVRVRNGGAVDHEHVWPPEACRTSAGGRVRCAAPGARIRVVPAGASYRFRVTLGRVALGPAFDASIGVVLVSDGAIDRVGSLDATACRRRTSKLSCRGRSGAGASRRA